MLLLRCDPVRVEACLGVPDEVLHLVQGELGRLGGEQSLRGLHVQRVGARGHPVQHGDDHLGGIHTDPPGMQGVRDMWVRCRQGLPGQGPPGRGGLPDLHQFRCSADLPTPGRGNQPAGRGIPLRAGQVPLP